MAIPFPNKTDKFPVQPKNIETEIENQKTDPNIIPTSNMGMLTIKTANEWIEEAKFKPIPKMLFGDFWFEYELCILFADTNLGKSILAVQIANSISKGEPIEGIDGARNESTKGSSGTRDLRGSG